jgi:very-short-patch-repair endonuclease
MAWKTLHSAPPGLWKLVRSQDGVIARRQLLDLGYTSTQIEHRLANGRLHRVFRGVYAVGRPEVSREGRWWGAILASGEGAALSHGHGGALYGLRAEPPGPIHVSVPLSSRRSRAGVELHPRLLLPHELTTHQGLPAVSVAVVLVDLAAELRRGPLEACINEADIRGLITVPALRGAVEAMPQRPGRKDLRQTIDRRTFRFTRSGLERAFIPLALSAGLSRPETRAPVNGFEVDFFWPGLALVVETDGGAYHRTPAQQAADRRRDQAHTAAGLTILRFTHSQIRYEPGYVTAMLVAVARRLRAEQVGRQLQQVGHR